jgi:DNA-binding response OmpR family regulator
MPRTVLVVDDDVKLADGIKRYLERERFRVVIAHDGRTALQLVEADEPALIVLDVMLPALDGIQLCRRVREVSTVPIIMVTARNLEDDRLAGFGVGADDYITKPFSPRELVARVHAVLRRAVPLGESDICLRFGNLEIDGHRHEVRFAGARVAVTRAEHKVLAALAATSGRALSRESLASLAFGPGWQALDRTLDAHVMKLRKKLEPTGFAEAIETVFGIGYRFNPGAARQP